MTVTLSQKSYDALLDDLERLRKCNIDLEEKLNKEVKLSYEIEGNLYDVLKERDKIINDMSEVKRKASLFDEIKHLVVDTKSAEDLGECVLQLLIENKEANHER